VRRTQLRRPAAFGSSAIASLVRKNLRRKLMNYDLWSEVTDVFCCEFFCWRMIRPTRRSFKSSLGRITLPCEVTRAQTRAEYLSDLEDPGINLILADYKLPSFAVCPL
jgi:hypothetical protein